jgi:cytoskeletal protein CcmA (bactofilin family)
MHRYKTPVYLSLLAALAASPTVVLADDVNCPPNLGNVTVDGNVLVAAPCRLDGTTVKGNVQLYAGGSLITRGNVRIEGSIQAENSDFIDVADTFVNGNIQLDNLVGDRSIVERSTVGGSIQLNSNRSRLEVLNNTVDSDVQAFANRGGVVIADNVIDGNLQCKENNPAPAGGNNRVQGNREDQCANLVPESGTSPAPAPAPAPTPEPTPPASADNSSGSSGGGGSLDLLLSIVLLLMASRSASGHRGRVV